MQNKYVVTDGETVLGTFRTKAGAEKHLKIGRLRNLDGKWQTLPESGFRIERRERI